MAISIMGFSADTGDKADTDYREEYYRLGFAERELLVTCGYQNAAICASSETQGGCTK